MRVLTVTELMRLARKELCDLATRITAALPTLPEGSVERANALRTLANIRFTLWRQAMLGPQ